MGKPIAIPGLEQKHLNPFPSNKKWTEWREALNSGPHILRKRERLRGEREKSFSQKKLFPWLPRLFRGWRQVLCSSGPSVDPYWCPWQPGCMRNLGPEGMSGQGQLLSIEKLFRECEAPGYKGQGQSFPHIFVGMPAGQSSSSTALKEVDGGCQIPIPRGLGRERKWV